MPIKTDIYNFELYHFKVGAFILRHRVDYLDAWFCMFRSTHHSSSKVHTCI